VSFIRSQKGPVTLYAATDTFQVTQRAAAERIARESGQHIDTLIDQIYRSARHQGFQSATLYQNGGRWFLRYVGNDSYSVFGSWYAFKNLPATEAVRAARAWYEQSPSKHTVYVSNDSADEAYGLACSIAAARRSQAVA
jgi:hypothetical protein